MRARVKAVEDHVEMCCEVAVRGAERTAGTVVELVGKPKWFEWTCSGCGLAGASFQYRVLDQPYQWITADNLDIEEGA